MPEKELTKEEIEKLPTEERIKILKDIEKKKKKEMTDIEALLNKSLRELTSNQQDIEVQKPSTVQELEDTIEQETAPVEPVRPDVNLENVEEFFNMYNRLQNYGELAKEGGLKPDFFETASNLYNQISNARNQVAYIQGNEELPSDQYSNAQRMQQIADVSKRIIKEIAGEYMANFLNHRNDYNI